MKSPTVLLFAALLASPAFAKEAPAPFKPDLARGQGRRHQRRGDDGARQQAGKQGGEWLHVMMCFKLQNPQILQ